VILEAGGGGRSGYGWREVQSGRRSLPFSGMRALARAGAIFHPGHATAQPSFKTCMNFFSTRRFPVRTCPLATQSVENTFGFIPLSSLLRSRGLVLVDSTHTDQREADSSCTMPLSMCLQSSTRNKAAPREHCEISD